jgi:sentrin-specific protease 1
VDKGSKSPFIVMSIRLMSKRFQIDIFSLDLLLIPVNHSNEHWTAAAINFRKKRFESYDSLEGTHGLVFQVCSAESFFFHAHRSITLKVMRTYVDAEHRDKKGKPFDFTDWVNWEPKVATIRFKTQSAQ